MDKLCMHCKHYKAGGSMAAADVCAHPILQPPRDLVRGEVAITFCSNQRSLGFRCGPDGKYWEAK